MPYLRDWIGIRAFINNFKYGLSGSCCSATDINNFCISWVTAYYCETSLDGYS